MTSNTQMDDNCEGSFRKATAVETASPQRTFETFTVQNAGDNHRFLFVLQNYNHNDSQSFSGGSCNSVRHWKVSLSAVQTVKTIAIGSCNKLVMPAHSVQYFKLEVPDPSKVANFSFFATASLDNDYVAESFFAGIASDYKYLPTADRNEGGYADYWMGDEVTQQTIEAGTYFVAVIAGVFGYEGPHVSKELICQDSVAYLESTPPLNVMFEVDSHFVPSCSGNGECSFERPGECECFQGWSGPNCAIAVCAPGCTNGGVCKAPGVCSCTSGWQGARCEVSTTAATAASTTTVTALAVCFALSTVIAIGLGFRQFRSGSSRHDDDTRHMLMTDA
jgi:hypothetical protein